MGLEKENMDTSVFMDDDEFNRSIEPILKKGKLYEAELDRDPNDINAQLKVGFEDVIAEPFSTPASTNTLLAVPMAFVLGLVFAVLSCIHIW
ncbi:hypothetical protein KUCAC02_021781 [Chaenocephalus aceratus]|uniref:Uncharacterized protein n=1 Tax=Chaenocephalus aceratus TaxID=36190 RepID=A0ACB9XIG0_CHAAC|nr:hypothetical protein KUCAC02_021781 [Chaenocephalus aceratus]